MWVWVTEDLTTSRLASSVSVQLLSYDHDIGIQDLGTMWDLQKGPSHLRCELRTHPLGWELRASLSNDLTRSQVCRAPGEVFRTAEQWRATAEARRWAEPTA
jgi:hypothetical protein